MQRGGIWIWLTIFALIIFGTIFAFKQAQESLPGELLYPLKETTEKFRFSLTEAEAASRALVTIELANERLEELEKMELKGQDFDKLMPQIEKLWATEQLVIKQLKLARERGGPTVRGADLLMDLGERQEIVFQRLLTKAQSEDFHRLLAISEQAQTEISSVQFLR